MLRGWHIDRRATWQWGFPLAIVVVFAVRFWLVNYDLLSTYEASLAKRNLVIGVAGGDVSLRDLPRAYEIARGRFFTDPHYEGEAPWYPMVSPLLAAETANATGRTVPSAYFLVQIWLCGAVLLASAWLLHRLGGWLPLGLLPVALGLGWLSPLSALYPAENARAFCFVVVGLLAARWDDVARGRSLCRVRHALALGLALAILGLWHGASFVIVGATSGVLLAYALARCLRRGHGLRVLGWVGVVSVVVGVVFGGAFLLPQVLRYGAIHQADSARLYLAPDYGYQGGTSLLAMLSLPLFPRGFDLVFLAVFVVSLARKQDKWRYLKVPLLMCYVLACLVGHLGFGMHDLHHRALAKLIRMWLPAPPHTFVNLARSLFPFIKVLALASVLEWIWVRAKRMPSSLVADRAAFHSGRTALVFVALTPLVWMDVPRVGLYVTEESAAFAEFARAASYVADDATTYIAQPFHFLGQAGFRLLYFGFSDHANHYVQAERERAQAQLRQAVESHRMTVADALLDKYDVRYLMRVDGTADPVVDHCGLPILPGPGFTLMKRTSCR